MRYLFVSLLLFCCAMVLSLSAQEDENIYFVREVLNNCFAVDNHDLIYDKGDTNYWIELGDFLKIESVEIIPLSSDTYKERVLVTNMKNNVSQYFYSRIISSADMHKITAIQLSVHEYTVTLEDGTHYKIIGEFYTKGGRIKVGDELKFTSYRRAAYVGLWNPLFTGAFTAIQYRDGEPINGRVDIYEGPYKAPREHWPINKPVHIVFVKENHLWFAHVGSKDFGGACFNVVSADKQQNGAVHYIKREGEYFYFEYSDGSKITLELLPSIPGKGFKLRM